MKTHRDYLDELKKLRDSGLTGSGEIDPLRQDPSDEQMPDIKIRIKKILNIIADKGRPSSNMIFFVMYDIESNKVRNLVSKYLIKRGCTRIQKSIFLADLDAATCDKIKADLAEVQQMYENSDSILICPVCTDLLRAMKVIGKNIDLDIILKNKNTLFF